MSLYNLALFVHMIGLVSLFGGLVLLQHGGGRLRAAGTWPEARLWLLLLRPVRAMFLAGGVFVLLTGLYMAEDGWTWRAPWVVTAIGVVVLFATLAVTVVGQGLARLTRLAAHREGPIQEDARETLRAPALWTAVFAMNGGALSMLWIMTHKPAWAGALGIPLGAMLLGAVVGVAVARRGAAAPVTRTRPADHAAAGAGAPRR